MAADISAGTLNTSVKNTINYIASVKWVFDVDKEKNSKTKELIVFIILSVIGLGINELIMWIMDKEFGIYYMISKIVATAVVMCYNFITRKLFLEKKKN